MARQVIKIDDLRVGSLLRFHNTVLLVFSIKTGTHDYLLELQNIATGTRRKLFFEPLSNGPTEKQEVEHIEVLSY